VSVKGLKVLVAAFAVYLALSLLCWFLPLQFRLPQAVAWLHVFLGPPSFLLYGSEALPAFMWFSGVLTVCALGAFVSVTMRPVGILVAVCVWGFAGCYSVAVSV
jgi:hypothetical protein